jgi:hypothetical protein
MGGWSQLEKGFIWKLYELKVLKRIYDRDTRSVRRARSNPRDLAVVTLHGLSQRRAEVEWCSRELRASLSGGAFGATRTFGLAVYALWLSEKTQETTPRWEGDDENVYRDVIGSWLDDAHLRMQIVRMCDYHVRRTIDSENSEVWMEFEFHPYPLFPIEYLALIRALGDVGRSIDPVDHELLSTPLANPPMESQISTIEQIAPALVWLDSFAG